MTSDKTNTSGSLKKIFNLSITVILTAFFLYIAFRDINFGEVMNRMSDASLFWVCVSISLLLFSHYLRALRWKIILNSVKPDTKISNLFGALMIGYGLNNVIPRLGEFYRAVKLAKWENLSKSSMIGTVVLERVIDMIFFGASVIIAGYVYRGELYTKFPWLKTTLYIGSALMFLGILFLIIVIAFREKFYMLVTKFVGRVSVKASEKLNYIFEMLLQGFQSLKGTKNYINMLGMSVLIMLTYSLNSYVGFLILKMEKIPTLGEQIDFGMSWVMMSISSIGVMIPTPGGIGSYHTITRSILTSLYGFDKELGAAYGTLSHAVSYFSTIVVAVLCFWILTRKNEH